MRLTVVGSAPSYTRQPGRASSCYLVEHAGTVISLDMGQGAFAALGATVDPASVTAIFISHLHPDHHIDLVPLRHYLRYACSPPPRVRLHGPAALRARYEGLMGDPDFLRDFSGEDLADGLTVAAGALQVEVAAVTHIPGSFCFRVSVPAAPEAEVIPGLIYSGDCGRAEDLRALIRPGDTLVCEATWGSFDAPADPAATHLGAASVAELARTSGVHRLLLTHILDERDPSGALEQARAIHPGPVGLAMPGLVVEFD